MDRNGVVNTRADAGGGQVPLQLVTVRCTNDIEVIDRIGPGRLTGEPNAVGQWREQLVVALGALTALFVPTRQMLEFDTQDPRLNCVESPVVALDDVMVLPGLAVVPQPSYFTCERLVVRGHRTGFAAGSQILARIETERGCPPHRPSLAPTTVLSREILRPVRLAGILYDTEIVSDGKIEDRVHVRRLPVQMHGDDCRHRASGTSTHHPIRS